MVLMSLNLGEDDLVVRLPIGIGDNIVAMTFTVKCTVITNLMNLVFLVSAGGRKLMKRICVSVCLSVCLCMKTTMKTWHSVFSRQFMIYHLKTTMSGKNLTLRKFSTFFLNLSWDDTLVKEQLNHDYESWLPGWGGVGSVDPPPQGGLFWTNTVVL